MHMKSHAFLMHSNVSRNFLQGELVPEVPVDLNPPVIQLTSLHPELNFPVF